MESDEENASGAPDRCPNVIAFPVRTSSDVSGLSRAELEILDEGIEKLDEYLAGVDAGRVQDLDGSDGFMRLAWRGRRIRLIRKWQNTTCDPERRD